MPSPLPIALDRAIEVAQHNRWYEDEGRTLVVFDSLVQDRYYGIRVEVEYIRDGWQARVYDGVQNYCSAYRKWRIEACRDALEGYLHVLSFGI